MATPDGSMRSAESSDANLRKSEESQLASLLTELTEAMRQGQQPDLEEVANRHPTLAVDLRSPWATIWVADEMARNGSHDRKPGATRDGALETTAWPPATAPGTARVALTSNPGSDSSFPVRFGEYGVFEELRRSGTGGVFWCRRVGLLLRDGPEIPTPLPAIHMKGPISCHSIPSNNAKSWAS
jgi:hypothetical protein